MRPTVMLSELLLGPKLVMSWVVQLALQLGHPWVRVTATPSVH